MKFIFAVLMATCGLLLLVEQVDATENQKLLAWIKDCQKQAGASNDDYETILKRKIPATDEGTCMIECIFNKLHIMENGRFNRKGFVVTFSPTTGGDLKKIAELRSLAAACEREVASPEARTKPCSTTKSLLNCFARNMDKVA
ncbi:general odorant-binding protein 19d-like [Euwallacea fornicatus]|uniref:general odorant-binding protein 19d-like n=1 Tax=Euwallacea fornicatus TaxID=995702 RepID=UPI00338EB703